MQLGAVSVKQTLSYHGCRCQMASLVCAHSTATGQPWWPVRAPRRSRLPAASPDVTISVPHRGVALFFGSRDGSGSGGDRLSLVQICTQARRLRSALRCTAPMAF